jgi:bifunctional non-homologous end joining protein LigD
VTVTNPHKVLWPATGFTKGDLVDYYARVAPVLLPHLRDRPLTLRPFPDGVEGISWYQENCRGPAWLRTHESRGFRHCVVDDLKSLRWVANRASIELHAYPWVTTEPERPTQLVFDLDPGEDAGMDKCRRVALAIRDAVGDCRVKTSGSLGLHVYAPSGGRSFGEAKAYVQEVAESIPGAVTTPWRDARRGKVLVDWLQNDATRTTVAPYSLRATPWPLVSTPLTWDEVERGGDLRFGPEDVLRRVDEHGDLFA